MVMNVSDALSAYRQVNGISGIAGAKPAASKESGGFGELLEKLSNETIDSLKQAEQTTAAGAVGKANLTDVVMAVNKAEMTLQTVVSIRDRVVSAYQEIIRMGV
ncbi:MAG: flagellar hook-basal body complex protein FliE [Alphaproteobacteria bacterium]|nr:flagellar hook-basal body complex protein FliE [Alphaproteobacteria bacterium]